MSYFDPKIYCKQNLKEADRKELEYWHCEFDSVICNAELDFTLDKNVGIPAIDAIINDIVKEYGEYLREKLGYTLQNNLVGCIENYGEDVVSEVEDPETFLYDREEDSDE